VRKQTHYEVLELESNASKNQIRRNYRRIALRVHPDKNPLAEGTAAEAFHALKEAHDVLVDDAKRTEYDRSIEMHLGPSVSRVAEDPARAREERQRHAEQETTVARERERQGRAAEARRESERRAASAKAERNRERRAQAAGSARQRRAAEAQASAHHSGNAEAKSHESNASRPAETETSGGPSVESTSHPKLRHDGVYVSRGEAVERYGGHPQLEFRDDGFVVASSTRGPHGQKGGDIAESRSAFAPYATRDGVISFDLLHEERGGRYRGELKAESITFTLTPPRRRGPERFPKLWYTFMQWPKGKT
jgi:curved DNA-binding protein CbpA